MKDRPVDFDGTELPGYLADGWGFDVASADYAAVGAGSYHWVVTAVDGDRGFVTVDDLDKKPWLGDARDLVFDGLTRSFDTAVALRDAGLGFVVAPIPTSRGETVRRIGPRYTVALFPFVDGRRSGRFGHETAEERAAVVAMLVELHGATPEVATIPRRIDLDLPGRSDLESALEEVDRAWLGGPFSEPARHVLAARASDVVELLGLADRLSVEVATRSDDWVVTHGEPHAGNMMRTAEGGVLVDWDTVALAPPERDLWMVVSETSDEAATIYADATGHRLDETALNFFRLMWDLADLASYLDVVRSPHRESEDTVKAYRVVKECLEIRDQWSALLP
jgi:hypothetical protein